MQVSREPLFTANPWVHKTSWILAALQYRLVSDTSSGKPVNVVKPYIIDLGSTNGTFVNQDKIEPKRLASEFEFSLVEFLSTLTSFCSYVELFEKDSLKFGFSTREYVLLNEHSAGGSFESDDEDGLA